MFKLKTDCLIVAALSVILSCSDRKVFDKFQTVSNSSWNKADEYFFKFNIDDNAVGYDLSVQLRNSNLYPYQNIWLLCSQLKGDAIETDTIQYFLADDFGRWTGNGVSIFQSLIPMRSNYFFPDTGMYSINIRHGMRDEILYGVEDVGLLITKTKSE